MSHMSIIGKAVTMNHVEQTDIIRKYKSLSPSSKEAAVLRDKLFAGNYGLIIDIASNYQKAYALNQDDLFQEGVLGMITALDRFDVTRGIRFCTYATYWINIHILHYIKKNSKIVMLSSYANAQLSKIKNEDNAKLNKKWGEYRFSHMVGLADPNSDKESIDNVRIGINDKAYCEKPSEIIDAILKTFGVKEKLIIRCRYSVYGTYKTKLSDIGILFGITQESVRQIERKALKKLKIKLQNIGIKTTGDIIDTQD